MNDQTLVDQIDPDIADRLTSRRGLFSASALKLGALASAPTLLAMASTEVFAQGLPQKIVDTLNFALTLEYIEAGFYKTALGHSGLIPGKYRDVFEELGKNERAHVAFLKNALGGAAVAEPKADFTAGGKYGDVFSNFETFVLLAQTFEETGVKAYKGQAGNLAGSNKLLTAALRIHSVEARHAAEVRRVRGLKAWDGAFDKPLSKQAVLAKITPFLV